MPFNATEFRSKFTPARPNRFEVSLSSAPNEMLTNSVATQGFVAAITNIIRGTSITDPSFLTFRAKTADLPAVSMEQLARFTNGPVRQVPAGNMFQPMLIEFYEDDNYAVRNFFDLWVRLVSASGKSYTVPYYDNIIVPELNVFVYNEKGKKTRQYTFYEVYPSSINPTQMAWDNQNSVTIVPIEFTYHRWTMKDL